MPNGNQVLRLLQIFLKSQVDDFHYDFPTYKSNIQIRTCNALNELNCVMNIRHIQWYGASAT